MITLEGEDASHLPVSPANSAWATCVGQLSLCTFATYPRKRGAARYGTPALTETDRKEHQ